MATPNTRQGLIDYALRKLGAPVIEINVDESQLEDLIDDAIQLYQMYHYDGSVRSYRKHKLTQVDIDNEWIPVTDDVLYIKRILPLRSRRSSSASMFDIRYQIHLNDLFDLAYAGTIAHYYQTKQYIDLLEDVINGHDEFEFSRMQDRLYLPSADWNNDIVLDDYVIIELYEIIDPAVYGEAYNSRWLKRYVTALFKKQWGANIKKFGNVQMPGGVVLEGQQVFDEGSADVEALEQELRSEWESPLSFLIG